MDIVLPQLAEGADSGTVVSIMVEEGQTIQKDQTILELENDKAVAPIPSTETGTVSKIYVEEGQTVNVGQKLIRVSSDGEEAKEEPKPEEPKREESVQEEISTEPEKETPYVPKSIRDPILGFAYESPSGFPPPAAPSIRKLARDIGLDLTNVRGSGRGGRILLDDIKQYIQRLQEIAFAKQKETRPEAGKAPATAPSIDFSQWGEIHKEKYSSIRKTIGQRMQESWNRIPHVYQFDEADITALMEMRGRYKSAYEQKNAKLTLTALAMKAAIEVLKKYPLFNASLDENTDEVIYKEYFHLGIAVDTEAGLLVPVVQNVDQKSLVDLCLELQQLAEKARNRKLSSEEMKGSSFTISNLGGIGGTHFTPIVNHPNTAILGMGRGVKKPAVVNDTIEPRLFLPLCVSYDHRMIDGADGARFIRDLVNVFENYPEEIVKLT